MRRSSISCGVLVALLVGCLPSQPVLPEPEQIAPPDPAAVERVLFLLGDAGEATRETHPVLARLQQDIEWWAERLGTDSAVTVLYLGDIVYPLGIHEPGTDEFPGDSAIVAGQVGVLNGPHARGARAQGYFMAGNHDWGLEEEWEGYVRLKNLGDFLDRARTATGAAVRLVPEAGMGGPFVLDLGPHVRILILDTAWWLLDGGQVAGTSHREVLEQVEEAMRTAGDRHVVIAAHHPFRSAGPHGGEFSFWRTLGLRYVLARSGAILQDVTSIPYRELEQGLRAIFARTGPPPVFIGGHEHSLQIIAGTLPTDPAFSLVSGSGSKLTGVGSGEGMRFGLAAPGYMRLVIAKDGGMSVYVEAAPEQYQECPGEDAERARCMTEGLAAFQTVHSQRVR